MLVAEIREGAPAPPGRSGFRREYGVALRALTRALMAGAAASPRGLMAAPDVPATREAGQRMGLAERRAVEQFKTERFPEWAASIAEAAGFDVPVEVAWQELAVADYADSYPEFFAEVYFRPLVEALRAVTVDEIGRGAARAGLSAIEVKNSGVYYSSSGFSFVDGVLTVDHQPHANIGDAAERAKALQRILESGL
jgi:hypothetical protein